MHRRGKQQGNQGPLSTQGQLWAMLMVRKIRGVHGSRTYGCGVDRVSVSEMAPSMGMGVKGKNVSRAL